MIKVKDITSNEFLNEIIEKSIAACDSCIGKNDFKSALVLAKQLLKSFPEEIRVQQTYGLILKKDGQLEEAKEVFKNILDKNPTAPEHYSNLSLCHADLGETDKAIELIKKAIEIDPNAVMYQMNYGHYVRQQGNLEEAANIFYKAIMVNEDSMLWLNVGGVRCQQKQFEEAARCLRRAIVLNPNNMDAHVDLSYIYHLQGDWDNAWREYEYRMDLYKQAAYFRDNYDASKKWTGKEDLNGKTLVLYCEQGIGDAINFVRFIPFLKDRGCNVVMETHPDLVSIMTHNNVATIMGLDAKESKYDYHCSILSLPYLLNIPKEQVPTKPYISPGKNAILKGYENYFKIGICWAGNPMHPKDNKRSFNLSLFRDIHNMPGVKLFSLQKDLRKRIHPPSKIPVDLAEGCEDLKIVDMSPYMRDFNESAAIVASLDLIITADTALLHLAGAMGKKTIALIPEEPDWRWGATGVECFWYPSVQLVRQHSTWEVAFEEVKKELERIR